MDCPLCNFSKSGLFVREVALSHTRGTAVGGLYQHVKQHRPFVSMALGAVYGADYAAAPDDTVTSRGQNPPTALSPIYFAEVEDGNRSLPALIRHCGALLVNFPNLHAVLGIKGEKTDTLEPLKGNALFLIQCDNGTRRPCLTRLIDFGPDGLFDTKRDNAQRELELPLPPPGEKPESGIHGAGVEAPADGWTWERVVNGRRENGQNKMLDLPVGLLLRDAHSRDNAPIEDIPDVNAQIDLGELADDYWA